MIANKQTHTHTYKQFDETALIVASSAGHVEVVQELIKAGANSEASEMASGDLKLHVRVLTA